MNCLDSILFHFVKESTCCMISIHNLGRYSIIFLHGPVWKLPTQTAHQPTHVFCFMGDNRKVLPPGLAVHQVGNLRRPIPRRIRSWMWLQWPSKGVRLAASASSVRDIYHKFDRHLLDIYNKSELTLQRSLKSPQAGTRAPPGAWVQSSIQCDR